MGATEEFDSIEGKVDFCLHSCIDLMMCSTLHAIYYLYAPCKSNLDILISLHLFS